MQGPTVLIVDDETLVLKTTSRTLSGEGINVLTAVSAAEAIAVMAIEQVDCLLCDHRMPGRSGLDLAAETHRTFPDMPIIVLSGGIAESQARHAVVHLGAHRVLSKPCPPEELIGAVKTALQESTAEPAGAGR